MDRINMVNEMLERHSLFRKSYIGDLEFKENKYEILNILMNRAINDSVGTYNIEKAIIRLEKIIEMNNVFEQNGVDGFTEKMRETWENSLFKLIDCEKSVIDINQYVNFNLQQYKKMLQIGESADINRDKLEIEKLKIKYMNKKRR